MRISITELSSAQQAGVYITYPNDPNKKGFLIGFDNQGFPQYYEDVQGMSAADLAKEAKTVRETNNWSFTKKVNTPMNTPVAPVINQQQPVAPVINQGGNGSTPPAPQLSEKDDNKKRTRDFKLEKNFSVDTANLGESQVTLEFQTKNEQGTEYVTRSGISVKVNQLNESAITALTLLGCGAVIEKLDKKLPAEEKAKAYQAVLASFMEGNFQLLMQKRAGRGGPKKAGAVGISIDIQALSVGLNMKPAEVRKTLKEYGILDNKEKILSIIQNTPAAFSEYQRLQNLQSAGSDPSALVAAINAAG